MKNFSRHQLSKLSQDVDVRFVQKRQVGEKELSYLPGWFVVSEANAIFGYDGWDRQTLELQRLFERTKMDRCSCGYLARIRVTVRAGGQEVVREGTGVGHASSSNIAEVHERAIKAAETDATKRALATFGGRFGLSLYRPSPNIARFVLKDPKGAPTTDALSPAAFAAGLRQMVFLCRDDVELTQLFEANRVVLEDLRAIPALQAASGRHYADVLLSLFSKHRQDLVERARDSNALVGIDVSTGEQRQISPPSNTETGVATDQGDPWPVNQPSAPSQTPRSTNPISAAAEQAMLANQILPIDPVHCEIMPQDSGHGAAHDDSSSPTRENVPNPNANPRLGSLIDKSVLKYSGERRIRNKEHLQYVASQPCLVCEQTPCHAHHITFAQPRGLSLKVSDEFTVPLCAIHHNALHQHSPERSWWANLAIDPLNMAADLWQQTLRRLIEEAGHKPESASR